MQPVKRNPYYRPAFESEARYRLIYGGSGSGKSVFCAQEEVIRAEQNPEHFILLVRKHKTDVRDSCFAEVKDVINSTGRRQNCTIRRNEMRITFDEGGEMLAVGMDDESRLKSIKDPTRVWVEEGNQISEGAFDELNRRMRGQIDSYYQITLTFNPEMGRTHWIRKRWFEDGEPIDHPRLFVMRTTHEHNPFLDEEYGEILGEDQGDDAAETVYKHGEFYETDDERQVIKAEWIEEAFERDLPKGELYLAGDIAGTGPDDTCLGLAEYPVITELSIEEEESTTATARTILRIQEEREIPPSHIVIDAGGLGAGTADTLKDEGLSVQAIKFGSGPVEDAIYKSSFFDFQDLRSQMWWHLRRLMRRGEIAFDFEHRLRATEELKAPRYRPDGKVIQVEPKRDDRSPDWGIRSRLGHSPDLADTIIQLAFGPRLKPDALSASIKGQRGAQVNEESPVNAPNLAARR